ncbi:alpha-xylosidase [Flavimobilis sp. GY10621]|uniref:Alpha-xylosidase n=1 Tax=Flavimobilis rhizosphaerae TaxID=2775421 RepID=A0ABR9DMZ0_9MICO|nr:alpha-xylosidase [Flavimobilis rhizosphaerae]MBD9698490.1 alpha-xylosidase [Flavimobilis rhizosphaerae]
MKFTDGYWQARAGMHPQFAAHAYDVWPGEGTLTAYAPTKRIETRGDVLNRTMLTVEYSAPIRDVVTVKVTQHAGALDRGPHFETAREDGHVPDVVVGDDVATLTSGDLSVRVHRGDHWQVDFVAGGRVLTSSLPKSLAVVTDDDGRTYLHEQLTLGVNEHVYGLGERFGPVVKNGQTVDVWQADGGTSSEQAYKNVPFYLTDKGYGVFVDQPELVSFEVASEVVSRTQFSVEAQSLTYHVIHGATPKAILERYTALTGRPARVPDWSFGLWLSTSFTTEYDEATVTGFIDGMAERDLPLSVFHFDCYWMREFNWCDFEWDPRTFPDPEGMLARLKARGLRVCVWINPYIAQRSPLFREAADAGYLVRRPDGSVWQWDMWVAGMGLVDFTNPEAAAWYTGKLERLMDMGVDAFKTDFGERIPTDVVWHDGSDPARMHNYYVQAYNRAVFEMLERRSGVGEAVLFARSATAGGQQFPVHWGGDCFSTFSAMAESLRGGLSLAFSGFGYWSHDIGGFEGTAEPAVFKRWLAFGLLSSHSRLHGSTSVRVPWAFDDEAVDVTRLFTRLKLSLMPYLGRVAGEAHAAGTPMARPMLLEFPEDPAVATLETQYMLGDALLVAPVFSHEGEVSYYVPAGTWTHLLDGRTLEGGRWVTESYGFDSLPLLVRPGTVLPVGARDDSPEYDWADGVTLRLFEIPDGFDEVVVVPSSQATGGEATEFRVVREGAEIRATSSSVSPWRLELGGRLVEAASGTAALAL